MGAGAAGQGGGDDGFGGADGFGGVSGYGFGMGQAGQTGVAGISGIGPSSATGFGDSTAGIGGLGVGVGGYGFGSAPSSGLGGGLNGSVGAADGYGFGNAGFGGNNGFGNSGYGQGQGQGQGGNSGYGGAAGFGGGAGYGHGGGGQSGYGQGGGATGGNAGGVGPGGHGLYGGGGQSVNDALNAQLEGLTSPVNLNTQYHLALAAMLGNYGHSIANANSAPVGHVSVSQLANPQMRAALTAAQIANPALAFNLAALSHGANMGFPSLGLAHTPAGNYGYGASAPPGSNIGAATISYGQGVNRGTPVAANPTALGFPAYGMNATALANPQMRAAMTAAQIANPSAMAQSPALSAPMGLGAYHPPFSAPQASPALSNFVGNLANASYTLGHGGH